MKVAPMAIDTADFDVESDIGTIHHQRGSSRLRMYIKECTWVLMVLTVIGSSIYGIYIDVNWWKSTNVKELFLSTFDKCVCSPTTVIGDFVLNVTCPSYHVTYQKSIPPPCYDSHKTTCFATSSAFPPHRFDTSLYYGINRDNFRPYLTVMFYVPVSVLMTVVLFSYRKYQRSITSSQDYCGLLFGCVFIYMVVLVIALIVDVSIVMTSTNTSNCIYEET